MNLPHRNLIRRSASGLVIGLLILALNGCHSSSGSSSSSNHNDTPEPPPPPSTRTLIAIDISPDSVETNDKGGISMHISETKQFIAMGIYDDGTQADITKNVQWESDNQDIVSITAEGMATANDIGSATIIATANSEGVSSNRIEINVIENKVVLQSIAVSQAYPDSGVLPLGGVVNLIAIGKYSDGTIRQLTNEAHWTSNNNIAVLMNGYPGTFHLEHIGAINITAEFDGIISKPLEVSVVSVIDLKITNPKDGDVLMLGQKVFPEVTGYMPDTDSTGIFSHSVLYKSSDNKTLLTSLDSIRTIEVTDDVSLSAFLMSIDAPYVYSPEVHLSIEQQKPISIQLNRDKEFSLGIGKSFSLKAIGVYEDGTEADISNSVYFVSDNPEIALPILKSNQLYGYADGVTSIHAELSDIVSNDVKVNITKK